MKVVGKGIPKSDGMAIVTGKPVYTEDLVVQNALTIKILRSPHAFAKIKSIDTSRAEKIDGVECILTYKDVPNIRFTLAGQSYPEVSAYDRLILEPIVRYVGDEVAIIAAVDEKTALKAMKLIKVEYEVFEPVLDFEKAEDNKIIIHPEDDVFCNFEMGFDNKRNIASYNKIEVGDVEKELEDCDVVIEETYYTQAQAHCMMETYRSFNYLDHMGRLVVVSSTQIPFHVRRQLARALDIPVSRIRVVKPRIGGGFGGKQTAATEIFSAIVTLKTGKPSMLIYDRTETFESTNTRHPMRIRVKMGADKDGYIKAIDLEALSDSGAYGEHAPTVTGAVSQKTLPLYNKTNAIRFVGKSVYTNRTTTGAFRGYGASQGTFAVESAVNKLAAKLNIDPTEIRLKNLIKEGETSLIHPDEKLGSSTLHKCIEKGKKLIGWDEKYPSKEIGNNKVRAVGMAVTMQGSGVANVDTSAAEVRLGDSGSYTLLIGSTDMGTGSDTILAQMAAEVLETTVDNIVVYAADTDASPFDPGSYASSTTYVTGMAVVKAAENLRKQMIENAAKVFEVTPEEVILEEDMLKTSDGSKTLTVKKLAETSVLGAGRLQLVGTATYGSKVSPPPFVAGFAEIELDKFTGKYEIIDYVAVVDCGTIINPNLVRIQTEGGIVQGIGMAMYEDVKYSETGKLQSNSFMQYKIPTRRDVGNIIADFVPSFEPTGPFGAKSIGEVVLNTPPPAIQNAVYNAVGVNITSLPITPEKVFMAMNTSLR